MELEYDGQIERGREGERQRVNTSIIGCRSGAKVEVFVFVCASVVSRREKWEEVVVVVGEGRSAVGGDEGRARA